jgi:hypothetical protein
MEGVKFRPLVDLSKSAQELEQDAIEKLRLKIELTQLQDKLGKAGIPSILDNKVIDDDFIDWYTNKK